MELRSPMFHVKHCRKGWLSIYPAFGGKGDWLIPIDYRIVVSYTISRYNREGAQAFLAVERVGKLSATWGGIKISR